MKLSFSRVGFKPDNFKLVQVQVLVEVKGQYGQRLDGFRTCSTRRDAKSFCVPIFPFSLFVDFAVSDVVVANVVVVVVAAAKRIKVLAPILTYIDAN